MPTHKNINTGTSLTPQQVLFCHEYIKDLNATQAAIRAEYSEKTARTQASQLLAKRNIQELIYDLNQERLKECKVEANFVLSELYKIANTDLADAFAEDGSFKSLSDIPPHLRKAIASIETAEYMEGFGEDRAQVGWIRKIKLWSKDKALENLGRHLKLFTDQLEHKGRVDFENLSDEELDKKINAEIKGSK